jgi:uncharacterized protein (DUF2235 family)
VSKNIVPCLDGTGNQLKASDNTNVVRLYEVLVRQPQFVVGVSAGCETATSVIM